MSRVSGQSFAGFARDRIFKPLEVRRTYWRDGFTRVVQHRALPYESQADGCHEDMPFENVHANGALLTTVASLLRWNENFVSPKSATRPSSRRSSRLTDGGARTYAFGLTVGEYRGVREVSHSGAAAGYRAFLTRFPDQHVLVAVLCDAASRTLRNTRTPSRRAILSGRCRPLRFQPVP